MEKEFVPYELEIKLKKLGCNKEFSNGEHIGILWQQAFDWFEAQGLFLDRHTYCSANEVIDMKHTIRSINGTWELEFPEPYSEFKKYEYNTIALTKMVELTK